ncbi:MAG TPA: DUF4214 domain-containing protein [Pirellulales bacterium]|nr:DUF4214 domain-containing protein [Pirellulales bacterium]
MFSSLWSRRPTKAKSRSARVRRRRFQPGVTALEPRILFTVQATSPSATLAFTEGVSNSPSLGTFSSPDTTRQTISAEIDWGDGGSSPGTIVATGDVTFSVTGSHTYADETAAGASLPVTVVVTDGSDKTTATLVDAATVADADTLTALPTAVTATENVGFSNTPIAQILTKNTSNPSGDFTATIDWGDGSQSAGQLTGTGGVFTLSGSHTYAEDGNYTVQSVVSDPGGASITVTGSAAVAEAPLAAEGVAVNGQEFMPLTAAVASFTHGDGSEPANHFAVTVDWGDGTSDAGTITESAGTYTVTGSHNYAEDGVYPVSAVIDDTSNGSVTANTTATIAEAPLAATGATLSGQAFSPLNGTVATFSHGSGAEAPGDFRATINWGDGSSSPGEVSVSGGTYSVFGSHAYTAVGVFGVNVRIDDLSSGSTTANSTATITAAPVASTAVAVVADEATTFAGPVVTFTQDGGSAPASNFSASIDWGDGGSSTGTVTAAGGGYVVSGSHLYAEDGSYPITVVVDNIDGSPTTIDTTATIVEAPLMGTGVPVTGIEVTNSTMPVATFTAGQEPVSSFTASIDWGEGVTTPGTITLLSNGQYQVSGTYGYLDEGSYPIAVTVTESGEPSSTTVIRTMATIDEGPPSADGPGIAGTPAQDYVSQLYRDVLDRPVDRPSSQILVNLLLAGQPRLVITEPLASSPEHLRLIVTQAYQSILGRAPDSAGLNYWTAALGRGVSDEQLAATMIASDEFFHAAGSDNRAWVDAMYLKLLGRTADSDGEAFWLNAMNHGQSRLQVALAIATSPEHEGSIVSADYAQLLHRTGSPAEINAWVLQMQVGMTDEALLARIAASDEYFDRLSEVQ